MGQHYRPASADRPGRVARHGGKARLTRYARLFATRIGPWCVLMVCAAVAMVAAPGAADLASKVRNDQVTFLPGDSESVAVSRELRAFPGGELTPALVVFRRDGGLTQADRRAIAAARDAWAAPRPSLGTRTATRVIGTPADVAAGFSVPLHVQGDTDLLRRAVGEIRRSTARGLPPGLSTAVTGPAGYSADAVDAFGDVNRTLFLAAAGLVLVLLLLIYRSPVFWVLPLGCVLFAEHLVRAAAAAAADAGLTINSQTEGILLVLVFGAGTDYALLLVARHREELRRHASPRAAAAAAVRRAGPAIAASAGTVVAGLLVLSLAQVNSTAGLGPVGALGVAISAVVMLTLLPALLGVCGRRVFWPMVPRVGDEGDAHAGVWARLGGAVMRRPRRTWAATLAALLALAGGLVFLGDRLTSADAFRGDVESVRGQRMLDGAFPAGVSAPTAMLVPPGGDVLSAEAAAASVPGVIAVGSRRRGPAGTSVQVVLGDDPLSEAAYDVIPELRRDVRTAVPGTRVGGITAIEKDLADAGVRDALVLPPLILVVVFAVLAALLRCLAAPLVLIATVIVSFAGALGFSAWFFNLVLGAPGTDPSLPLYGFVFLVALGVDYSIFLMARAREETPRHGTRGGMLRALSLTGGVITSAGVVLAGTFAMLCLLPLWALVQVGFLVAFGVLLDTLVVRTLLVPAIVADMGRRVWWPSSLSRPRDAP